MKQIWEELGTKIKELLELAKTGVVASILAACQRLETNRLEVFFQLEISGFLFENICYLNMCDSSELQSSEALSAAITSDSESPDSIVAHILFLENFLREKSYWKWPAGVKMSVLGCLMLQSIFQYPHVCITDMFIKFVVKLSLHYFTDPGFQISILFFVLIASINALCYVASYFVAHNKLISLLCRAYCAA
jgi:hypothetical protein